jgi:hypothetical protein
VAPAAPGERIYEEFGVRLLPAPQNASPKVTQGQAISISKTSSYDPTGTPRSELRLYTDGDFPPDPVADPNPQRHYDHRLVWFITYFDTAPSHPRSERGQEASPQPENCDVDIVVDADTGEFLKNFQYCPGTPANDR